MGWIYGWGAGSVRKDIQKSNGIWKQAVKRGHDEQFRNGLGLLYHYGRGVVLIDGAKERGYYEMAMEEVYPATDVIICVFFS